MGTPIASAAPAAPLTIFDDAPPVPVAAPALAAAAAAHASASAALASDAKMAATSTTEEWRWTFSTPTHSANAAAAAPATAAGEADVKAGAVADLGTIKQRITIAIKNIRSLFLAGIQARHWDLGQIRAIVLTLPELFKQHHRLEKPGSDHCQCRADGNVARSIINQIDWFRNQAAQTPTTNDRHARIYKKGLQLHFKRLLGRIESAYRSSEPNDKLEADNKEFISTHFFSKKAVTEPVKQLKRQLVNAALELRYEDLAKLIDALNINIIALFFVGKGPFEAAIDFFCKEPTLTPKYFQILELLIDAGFSFRGNDQLLSYRDGAYKKPTYARILEADRYIIENAAVQLIHYLHQKGLDPNEAQNSWEYDDVRTWATEESPSFSNRTTHALLEIGLDMREEWRPGQKNPVTEVLRLGRGNVHSCVKKACLMIGAGTIDGLITVPAAKEAFLKSLMQTENLRQDSLQIIARTVDRRLHYLNFRSQQPGRIRDVLGQPNYIPITDLVGIVVDFARLSDSDIAANIWAETFIAQPETQPSAPQQAPKKQQ